MNPWFVPLIQQPTGTPIVMHVSAVSECIKFNPLLRFQPCSYCKYIIDIIFMNSVNRFYKLLSSHIVYYAFVENAILSAKFYLFMAS